MAHSMAPNLFIFSYDKGLVVRICRVKLQCLQLSVNGDVSPEYPIHIPVP